MEWRKYYMDVMFVPMGLVIILTYHFWLWHKSRTQPFTTTFGRDADGRRLWVPTMMKDIEKKNIVAVQSIRNVLMGSTLMATTAILICAGLGAVISSTYSVKKPIIDSVFGAHGEFMVGLKYATLLGIFTFSFLCHTSSIVLLNQVNILICTPQDAKTLVTPQYLSELFDKATLFNTVGNRLFYSALPLLLWIFGPVFTFLSSLALLFLLYNLDFLSAKTNCNHQHFLINAVSDSTV